LFEKGGDLMKISKDLSNVQKIIQLAEENGWSEEELAKAIEILHSSLQSKVLI